MTLLNSSLITNIFPHHNFSSKLISYRFTSSTGCLRIFSQFLTKWLFLITNFYLLSFHFNQGYNIGILFYNGYDFNALKPHTNFWVHFHKKNSQNYMLADMVVYFLGRSTTVDFISDKLLARCKKLYSPPTRVYTRSDSRVLDYFDHPASSFLSNHGVKSSSSSLGFTFLNFPPHCYYQGRFT